MKNLKNRWENELKNTVPALSESVKKAEIPKADTYGSIQTRSTREVKMKKRIWNRKGFWALATGGAACAVAAVVLLPTLLKDGTDAAAKEMKVMNVSCNPSVEFVLSEDNLVVSANALNEEGNLVVSAEAFVGKTAEEAAHLFVEVAQESGFIVACDVDVMGMIGITNKIEIAFSGDEKAAEELFAGVNSKINEYFSENSINGVVAKGARITEEELKDVIAECLPYMEETDVRAMDYATLMEELASVRKETQDIYSQELKAAYYEMKSFAMEQAELDAVKAQADAVTSMILEGLYAEYATVVSEIEDYRMTYLVNEDSLYQQALTDFRTAKIEYLNYRNELAQMEMGALSETLLAPLAEYEETLNTLHENLLTLGETAEKALDDLKTTVENAFARIGEGVKALNIDKAAIEEYILAERQKAHDKFEDDFKVKCDKEIGAAHDRWMEMKGALNKGKPNGGLPLEVLSGEDSGEETDKELSELENGENYGGEEESRP